MTQQHSARREAAIQAVFSEYRRVMAAEPGLDRVMAMHGAVETVLPEADYRVHEAMPNPTLFLDRLPDDRG